MLYGIQRQQQLRLAREGQRLRVLISYGEYWFPWYMRRLAERPANVWFVVRTMFGYSRSSRLSRLRRAELKFGATGV